MQISKGNAMQIVNEMRDIIGQHVNLMDSSGIIIASTDPRRVGTFHEGAMHVVQNNLEELIIQSDHQYEGTRQGINLPILFDGKIVGVIGLTGERDQVVKYGQIIKKMTEILLLDTMATERKKIDDRIKNRFLDEWVHADPGGYSQALAERGLSFGIDVAVRRRVIIASILNLRRYSDSADGQRLIDNVNKTVRSLVEAGEGNVFMKTSSSMICLLTDREDGELREFVAQVEERVWNRFSLRLAVGIDSRADHHTLLHRSYVKAKKAYQACLASQDHRPRFYDDISLELFMGDIPLASKKEFVLRIFRGYRPQEIAGQVVMLQTLFDADGSITAAAQQLYLHKNTLQYKLNRLHEKTGYNPRSMSDSALFFLALQFYRDCADELLLE